VIGMMAPRRSAHLASTASASVDRQRRATRSPSSSRFASSLLPEIARDRSPFNADGINSTIVASAPASIKIGENFEALRAFREIVAALSRPLR
jgi:hypothetical protein